MDLTAYFIKQSIVICTGTQKEVASRVKNNFEHQKMSDDVTRSKKLRTFKIESGVVRTLSKAIIRENWLNWFHSIVPYFFTAAFRGLQHSLIQQETTMADESNDRKGQSRFSLWTALTGFSIVVLADIASTTKDESSRTQAQKWALTVASISLSLGALGMLGHAFIRDRFASTPVEGGLVSGHVWRYPRLVSYLWTISHDCFSWDIICSDYFMSRLLGGWSSKHDEPQKQRCCPFRLYQQWTSSHLR
jgi:hypothetical protein